MANCRDRHVSLRVKLILVALTLLGFFFLTETAMRDTVRDVIRNQARMTGLRILSESVSEVLDGEQLSYDQLVHIVYGENQRVSAVEVDSVRLNRLRSDIVEAAADRLGSAGEMQLAIPLGSLTGNEFFMARGPDLHFELYPTGYLTSRITSEFDSAGINQTRHRIVLTVEITLSCAIPFYRQKVQVQTEVIIAETIIVGEVPEYYTQVINEGQTAISEDPGTRARLFS